MTGREIDMMIEGMTGNVSAEAAAETGSASGNPAGAEAETEIIRRSGGKGRTGVRRGRGKGAEARKISRCRSSKP